MTPEYLLELADRVDPDRLWRISRLDQTADQRWRRDAGIALRQHAEHQRQMLVALAAQKSLLITPLGANSSIMPIMVETPEDHALLRDAPSDR